MKFKVTSMYRFGAVAQVQELQKSFIVLSFLKYGAFVYPANVAMVPLARSKWSSIAHAFQYAIKNGKARPCQKERAKK
ncbi:hypothetical protein A3F55_03090 [Candidatus Adlerbacteria bacterium RIFCSPHIGHO2_12_FULL_53_18]|uniref:Uncharacterized protein n=1 Tax=Candidatus Adlerbacteria bacterium RIFCSPHIGHO2_12_FULL_53_18 TaxID=1797242 RepID=A0A1F4XTZ7_9BACT|nr:MAG: hypothetical protein A3F55_03090 [Candidatus Adlerbacteria bacterium RIFCSPHIGHO2_12_FULL_53_18]